MRYFDVLTRHHSQKLLGGYIYGFESNIPRGTVVKIPFRQKHEAGIVSGEIETLSINPARVKKIISADRKIVVPDFILKLSETVSKYYCTSQGETIFELLPNNLESDSIKFTRQVASPPNSRELIVGYFQKRMLYYLQLLSQSTQPTLILLPNYRILEVVKRYLLETMEVPRVLVISDRLKKIEYVRALTQFANKKVNVVLSVRGGVKLLGLGFTRIIIDDPLNYGFYNDRKPAYLTRLILETLQESANYQLYLGSSSIDPESLYQLRHGQISLNKLSGHTNPLLKWSEVSIDKLSNSLGGKINLIVCPYSSLELGKASNLSVRGVVNIVSGDTTSLEAGKAFTIPNRRPITIVATKKILDYQELLFDETVILGLDHWLSQPGSDNMYETLDMIWRLMGQTKNKFIVQSSRPVALFEEMLGLGIPSSLEKFMSSRYAFKLPPYSRKVDIYCDNVDNMTRTIVGGVNTVADKKKLSTFIPRNTWPPKNIDEVYRLSNKVLVDAS